MRKFLPIILMLAGFAPLHGQFGALDPSFDSDGIAYLDTSDTEQFNAMALQPDGKIVAVGGYGTGIESYFLIARFNPDGSRDLTFNTFGYELFDFEPGTDNFQVAYDVLVEPDGKIVVAGSGYYLGDNDMMVLRLLPDGRPDSSFTFEGFSNIHLSYGSPTQSGTCIARTPDGYFYVGGIHGPSSGPSSFLVAKLDPEGFAVYPFGSLGFGMDTIPFAANENAQMWDIQVLADGRVICGGHTTLDSSNTDIALAMLFPTGVLDSTFSGDGKLTLDVGSEDACYSVIQQADGKLVAAGSSGPDLAAVRIGLTGLLDAGFDGDGIAVLSYDTTANMETYREVVQQTDGKLLLGGQTHGAASSTLLARLLTDGSPDPTFGAAGKVVLDIGTGANAAWGLAIQPDEKVLACGRTGFDAYVARFFTGLEVAVEDADVNAVITLYPNPVLDEASIRCHLRSAGQVELLLTDMQGRVLRSLGSHNILKSGPQDLKLNLPTGLASGEYLVVLVTAHGSHAVRMQVM